MKPMQVVIPMAGTGRRFAEAGYAAPKPLLDVAGKPLIERLLAKFPRDWSFVFIANQDHLQSTPLKEVLLRLVPNATIIGIAPHRLGPVHTVLAGKAAVRDDLPTLVNYCDFSFSWDAERFSSFLDRTPCDGALLCYRGFHPHYLHQNLYAYCREEGGRVLAIKEKGHFTSDRTQEYASSGTYYFSSGRLLKTYFESAVTQGLSTNGEYYVSLVYDAMLRDQKRVLVYEIPFFLQWGTPEDLEDYLYWHRVFQIYASWENPWPAEGPRLVMPMAGLGSRFQGFDLPKPLVPVLGQPMYKSAQKFLPKSRAPEVLVFRSGLRSAIKKLSPRAKTIVLGRPTAGQADTTAKALSALNPKESVLVSACDHGLLWNPEAWKNLLHQKPDVIVFGQRGYPGARRAPTHFSYIDADDTGRIRRVSVKKPFTKEPQKELVLVGTFYAAQAGILKKGIDLLIKRNIRVNGERYLDSVISLLIDQGLDVRCFETQGFLNWGSPDALAEFSYWHHYFQGIPA